MQISTNWSVSHLRHWRPPVTRSGRYLNRCTRGSWFKSKQSALRSILPNANIHHNEKSPGRGQGQTPSVHFGVCFSTWGVQQVKNSPPFWSKGNSTHQTDWEDATQQGVDDGWLLPLWKWSWMLVTDRKQFLVFDSEPTGENDVPVKFRDAVMGRNRLLRGWGQGVESGGPPWVKPQLRERINSKPAAKQYDFCSLRKYHSTLFTIIQGGIKTLARVFLPTLNMYRGKVVGVFTWKAAGTNIFILSSQTDSTPLIQAVVRNGLSSL